MSGEDEGVDYDGDVKLVMMVQVIMLGDYEC